MPSRTKVDRGEITRVYGETRNGLETARVLGIHPNTVYQALRVERGRCRNCARNVAENHSYCETCLDRLREKERLDRKARRRLGLCVQCDEPIEPPSRQYCAAHRMRHIEASERYEANARMVHGSMPEESRRVKRIGSVYGAGAVVAWTRHEGRCALCGVPHRERAVHIHHIDMNQENNAAENLTCLCQRCHRLVHGLVEHPDPKHALQWIRATYPDLI